MVLTKPCGDGMVVADLAGYRNGSKRYVGAGNDVSVDEPDLHVRPREALGDESLSRRHLAEAMRSLHKVS
jgi:hypothetical protein